MNLTPERQGYLGDLMAKTVPQLKELLERQEKLLSNRKFLERLADKGEKTRKFAAHLKDVIDLKLSSSPSSTGPRVMKDLSFKQNSSNSIQPLNTSEITSEQDQLTLQAVAKRDEWNVTIQQTNATVTSDASEEGIVKTGDLVASLEGMSLGNGDEPKPEAGLSHFNNSYERVIKKAENDSSNKPHKFVPNRFTHEVHIPKSPNGPVKKIKKPDVKEESAVNIPPYKFQESKLISIEESVHLIEQQRARNEELIAEKAAKKLADQLTPKMDIYSPNDVDMQYREPMSEEGQDSDDDSASEDEE